jgi:hypothetical protein
VTVVIKFHVIRDEQGVLVESLGLEKSIGSRFRRDRDCGLTIGCLPPLIAKELSGTNSGLLYPSLVATIANDNRQSNVASLTATFLSPSYFDAISC